MKRRNTSALAAAAALAIASFALAPAAAQEERPDFSGFWDLSRPLPEPDPGLMEMVAPNTVVVPDAGAAELPKGEYGGLEPTAEALAVAEAWEPRDDMTLSLACQPPSIVYAMQGPFPMEIYQGTELIVIKLEFFDMVRVVFMDGRDHPPANAPHSKTGHSVGHWEGDVLVIDTTHLSPATITNNGLFHSEDMHLIERFRLSDDGQSIVATQEFEDPQSLHNRGVRVLGWTKHEGAHIYPYECDPSFVLDYIDIEGE
ncbi:MAG: hypothetical protein PVI23_05865 [Maricaulaceae bacterium]